MRTGVRSLKDAVLAFVTKPGARAFFEEHIEIDPTAWRWPVIVDITTGCNLHCPSCWNTEPRKRNYATDAVLERLVEELLPYAEDVAFGCRHEAALHPELPSLLRAMDDRRRELRLEAKLVLLSSGSLFDESLSDALAFSGVDYVLFSIDSTDPEIFARLRPPSTWPVVRERVAAFVAACEGSSVQVGAQALLLRSTLSLLESSLVELAGLGVGSFAVSQAVPLTSRIVDDVLRWSGSNRAEIDTTMEALEIRAKESRIELFVPRPAPAPIVGELFPLVGQGRLWDEAELRDSRPSVCAAPWSRLRVDHEGNVYP